MTATLHDRGLVWLRRDLRTQDHTALHQALAECRQVYCAFVFDRDILEALPQRADRRVAFIHGALMEIEARRLATPPVDVSAQYELQTMRDR